MNKKKENPQSLQRPHYGIKEAFPSTEVFIVPLLFRQLPEAETKKKAGGNDKSKVKSGAKSEEKE